MDFTDKVSLPKCPSCSNGVVTWFEEEICAHNISDTTEGCYICGGTGKIMVTKTKICYTCNGRGYLTPQNI